MENALGVAVQSVAGTVGGCAKGGNTRLSSLSQRCGTCLGLPPLPQFLDFPWALWGKQAPQAPHFTPGNESGTSHIDSGQACCPS